MESLRPDPGIMVLEVTNGIEVKKRPIDVGALERGLATGNIQFETRYGNPFETVEGYEDIYKRGVATLTSGAVFGLRKLPPKGIQKEFPKVAGLLAQMEGKEYFDWIEDTFGTVYHYLPAVRPWDIKFPKVELDWDDERFVPTLVEHINLFTDWNGSPNMVIFNDFDAILKPEGPHSRFTEHSPDNPYIDQDLLRSSMESRKEKEEQGIALPDSVTGVFSTRLESIKGVPLKVMALGKFFEKPLDQLGVRRKPNQARLATQLNREFGIDPRNPVLAEFGYNLDPSDFTLTVSNDPLDILYSSTDKPWHSCTCQDVSHQHGDDGQPFRYQKSPYWDIAAGSAIAYLTDAQGKFVGRSILRMGIDERTQQETGEYVLGVGIERYYGDPYFNRIFNFSVSSLLHANGVAVPGRTNVLTWPISSEVYPDRGHDVLNEDKYTPSSAIRALRYWRRPEAFLP